MTDHYHGFDHPVLRDLPETPPADFLTEMDTIADELRENPKHIADDDQIAFRQLQRLRLPDLSTQQFLDLFAVWRDRYQARQDAKAAETSARLTALWAERDSLFEKRASMPPSERADVDALIAAIGREPADLVAPQRAAIADLIRDG
jgi:hypothetical protein